MEIRLRPVAVVSNVRIDATDDFWGDTVSVITLNEHVSTEAFDHIEDFSHLEIVYYFDQVDVGKIVFAGHPRGNTNYPKAGIFAQRKKDRPNQIGICTVELVSHSGREIEVKYLDAINGTPVLDIKPVMKEFEPKGAIKQPAWVSELMKDYWE